MTDIEQKALVERLRNEAAMVAEDVFQSDPETLDEAADRIEVLEAEVKRLRFHLNTALEALIMEGVCDGECSACKAARAALGEKQ